MPKLQDYYKEYKNLLVQQDSTLGKLADLKNLNKEFLGVVKNIYDNHKTAELQLLGLCAKLGGQQEDLKKANGDPAKSDALNESIKQTKERIIFFEQQKKECGERLPWKDAPKLTAEYLIHYQANLKQFQQYMDCYKQHSDLCLKLIDMQHNLMTELNSCAPQEREKGLAWSKENIASLQKQVYAKQYQDASQFAPDLQRAYLATCMAHANFLGKQALVEKVEASKISLSELEELVAHRQEKQNLYRSLLPHYVVAEIPPNAHIQGKRALNLFATNTESKVRAVTNYLETSLSDNQSADQRKIKDLFATININLNDGQITRIYNAAKEKPLELDAQQSSQARIS